ncbi:MAG: A/G-specific adenine glycosylase [Hyphomicrobiales bacterium]|nr:MAG: A/G-specific adenine glycosylase [Hyphomicrobiales bacterium]
MDLNFSKNLLAWYDKNGRELPWRIRNYGGMQNLAPDPYSVWLSEIMLQQTVVATVKDYYAKFTKKWPTVQDLAAAEQDEVLTAWAGLGYYARARNLHKCAQHICDEFNGQFPKTEIELLTLPGVGPYTAAAITSIAFNQKANVVDGNVERIFSRVDKLEEKLPAAKKQIYQIAQKYLPKKRFGDYAQALMDLGATVCKPKNPRCETCPVSRFCTLSGDENVQFYPKKTPKKPKKQLKAHIFWVENVQKDQVLLQKRAEKGLLGNMMEFPSTNWLDQDLEAQNIGQKLGEVTHIFTHIKLVLKVWKIQQSQLQQVAEAGFTINLQENGKWVNIGKLDEYALPSLMQKIRKLAEG